jgi:acyl-CoA dehydrogenase
MDFELSEELKMLQKTIAGFVDREIVPIAPEVEEEERFPYGVWQKLADMGMCAATAPKEYGGGDGGEIAVDIITEELSRGLVALGTTYLVSCGIGIEAIYAHGTEEQKKECVARNNKGDIIFFAVTEASGGSDVAGMQSRYRREGDYFILNGTKCFISNGEESKFGTVYANSEQYLKTNPDPAKVYRGISEFIVEKGTPGFTLGKKERKMGQHSTSTYELVFQDCKIPARNLVGEEGHGFYYLIEYIDASRCSVAAQGLGVARAAFAVALDYAKERKAFGKLLAEHELIQGMLADMYTAIEASRLLIYHAAWLKDTGRPYFKEAAAAKVFATEASRMVCDRAIQIHGGYGYMEDYPLARYYRDQRITEIYEGTSEMQRWTIARQLTGLK